MIDLFLDPSYTVIRIGAYKDSNSWAINVCFASG